MKNFRKTLTLAAAALLAAAQMSAATGKAEPKAEAESYKIRIDAPQLKNRDMYLGVYFYGKLYSRDSVRLDAKGTGYFQKEKRLPEGMYVMYYSSSDYFDVLIADDQDFSVRIDTTDLAGKSVFSGAEQTEAFSNYVKFLATSRAEVQKINEKYKDNEERRKAEAGKIDEAVKNLQTDLKTRFDGKTVSLFLKANDQVEIPEFEEIESDSVRRVKRYYYYREHFFDNIPLSDQRMVYSPFLSQKVNYFIENMVPQIPDTLNVEIVKLVEKSKGDTLTFQNMLSNMLNYAIKSNAMGMDRVVLTLSEKYYLSGQAYWADSTLLKNLKDEVAKIKFNQIGDKAHDLLVETIDGQRIRTNSLPADYVLVFFFEPSCGHCKVETPKLYNTVYQKYKDKGFEVAAFYIQTDRKEWEEFIEKHGLRDWKNVWDPTRESHFWYYFDVTTTPGVYLLDKDRKIVAKKISVETLDTILEHELGEK